MHRYNTQSGFGLKEIEARDQRIKERAEVRESPEPVAVMLCQIAELLEKILIDLDSVVHHQSLRQP